MKLRLPVFLAALSVAAGLLVVGFASLPRMAAAEPYLAVEAGACNPLVDPSEQPVHLEVRQRALISKRSGEQRFAVANGRQPTDQAHAQVSQRVQVHVPPIRRARELE